MTPLILIGGIGGYGGLVLLIVAHVERRRVRRDAATIKASAGSLEQ